MLHTPARKAKGLASAPAACGRALERLKRRNDRTDFSDLMQALLEAWLQTPE